MAEPQITSPTAGSSLPEVHSSVGISTPSLLKRLFAFSGPAYLISVGYMDPGNWATDLEGGARFGYQLLWVLVMSNLMAVLLQTLSARLGIVTQRDLAQACRESYPSFVSYSLWGLCEIAIAACDLAEVLGAAIALNLLFHIPLLAGVLITSADTLLVLWFTRMGIRVIEAFVLVLVATITACFLVELAIAKPAIDGMVSGLIPHINEQTLFAAVGILGATVMPHNLYLHSALVQTRRIGSSLAEKRTACRFNLIDSVVALNGAMIVNASILILAATVFFQRQIIVTEIQQAHLLLSPLLGTTVASFLFAVALLCSGQSSTLTGTLAGQIIMEGFLNLRMRPWLRRMITRSVAIVPAAVVVYIAGDKGSYQLILLSQVILSMQLPFAVIPLVRFTGDRERMGEFVSPLWVRTLAWTSAAIVVALNLWLASRQISEWFETAREHRTLLLAIIIPVFGFLALLLAWITLEPFFPPTMRRLWHSRLKLAEAFPAQWTPPVYKRILLPLDHSDRDTETIAHAAALAKAHGSKLHLLHIEEDLTSQIYGALSSTAEVELGREYFSNILGALKARGIQAELVITSGRTPRNVIIEWAREHHPDLIVMGAHGHRGLKDLALGKTIDAVRHALDIPILVVRGGHKDK